ncbi:MAG: cysteine--tRNA ligase [Patescibacteria group bacterium]
MLRSFFKKRPARTLPPLRLYNTLSGKQETFEPVGSPIKVYNCGPTAYDRQHIGNLLPPVVANVLHRTLEAWGHNVSEVNNITDFGHISEDEASEDKMTKGMKRERLKPSLANMRKVADKYANLFFDDLPLIGVDPKRVKYPFASDYIAEQIAVVKTLMQKGYAYQTSDGVYYDVSRFAAYGKLGGIELAGQRAGARVEQNTEKRGPFDFALWKLDAKFGWESPWGKGFPGWHTECVAMIFALLGRQIDIHMGGIDLIGTHHNNEIAQAEAITAKQFVRYWVHNAHITVDGKKISKSLGNTIFLSQIVDRGLDPRALRYWFMTSHYRTPSNFTWEALEGADVALGRLKRLYLELPPSRMPANEEFLKDFYAAIAEDLNTPRALARVWDLVRSEDISPAVKKVSLAEADKILGLGLGDSGPKARLTIKNDELPDGIKELLAARESARVNKDYEKSDELRKEIESAGYDLKDTPSGPTLTKR